MTDAAVLSLAGFGVAFRDRVVLADVSFDVPLRGVLVVMGPAGGGKSTLLRTLAGLNHAQPELRQWGSALYQGLRLEPLNRPALVQQDVRYVVSTVRENLVSSFPDRRRLSRAEQNARLDALLEASGVTELRDHLDDEAVSLSTELRRLLATLRAMATGAPVVCLDETTAGLEDESAGRLLALMRWYARTHAVLFVTHHQLHAKASADVCLLLAGGRVQECAPSAEFFHHPRSHLTRHYLETGSVSLPAPDAAPETLADDVPPPPPLPPAARAVPSSSLGPRGFRWLLPGQLGGLPRPGIVASVDEDVAGLRRLGVTVLVTLEETVTVPRLALEGSGVAAIHFPIVDMEAPETVPTAGLCRRVEQLIQAGEVVAYHCRAGHGRTGTLLACQLIWAGASAVEALDRVRSVNPKWVTSDVQVRFLETFSDFVRWQSGQSAGLSNPAVRSPS
ncbi:MAG: ATP-binding cassette domain-containing protein [Archangium sp.]|nr:ATP-binding cassette domain-containing protein [Archangium sp.]